MYCTSTEGFSTTGAMTKKQDKRNMKRGITIHTYSTGYTGYHTQFPPSLASSLACMDWDSPMSFLMSPTNMKHKAKTV